MDAYPPHDLANIVKAIVQSKRVQYLQRPRLDENRLTPVHGLRAPVDQVEGDPATCQLDCGDKTGRPRPNDQYRLASMSDIPSQWRIG